ncbi:MAG: AMP-binding protein [Desulfomonilaceae bacterium]
MSLKYDVDIGNGVEFEAPAIGRYTLLTLLNIVTSRKLFSRKMIKTRLRPENPEANLKSYYEVYRGFSWPFVKDLFPSYSSGFSNIVSESVDRWAADRNSCDRTALIFERAGEVQRLTYTDLRDQSSRMANLILRHGIRRGDALLICCKPCPEVHIAVIACARIGARFCNLGDCLIQEQLHAALNLVRPRGVLIHNDMPDAAMVSGLDGVEAIFVAGEPESEPKDDQIYLHHVLPNMDPKFDNVDLPIEEPLYQTLVWESSGELRLITHAHRDMIGAFVTGKFVLDLKSDSVLWTDANPGAVASVIYGIFAPMLCGCATVIQGDTFAAPTWYWTLETLGVSVWFTDTLKLKRFKAEGDDLVKGYDFSNLQHMVTIGEPLTAELFQWSREKFKRLPHEVWMTDETGMVCFANFASEQIKIGSIGKPVPGIRAEILDEQGQSLPILTLGRLALNSAFPNLALEMSAKDPTNYMRFKDGWFLTGDLALKDEDGYFYYFGRVDHLVNIGQLLTGAPEIESVLLRYPEISDAGVISKKCFGSETCFKAFLKLKNSHSPSPEFLDEITKFVRLRMREEIPNLELEFIDDFPVSSSRRLLRRVLLARELGLPVGVVSNLKE